MRRLLAMFSAIERRLSTLLNAHSLASSVIKRAISFGLNLHGAGYDVLRSPLSFGENFASPPQVLALFKMAS
jgi:hypothetical protein